jgi:hypothetical protein
MSRAQLALAPHCAIHGLQYRRFSRTERDLASSGAFTHR